MEKIKCVHDRYRWSNTLNEGICIDCMAKLLERPEPLSHSDKQGAKEFELKYCDKCIQMTNHQNGSCRKCVQRGAEEIFCKLYSSEYGEKVDSIYQIKIDTFDGLELLTLCKKYAQAERQRALDELQKYANEHYEQFSGMMVIRKTDLESLIAKLKESSKKP